MRLELLSTFYWNYEEDVRVGVPGYSIASAYDSEEGIGYGEGRGTATGQIEGTKLEQDCRPVVGRVAAQSSRATGRQNLVGWFESDHTNYRWLNDVVCIGEGTISAEGIEIHIYAGVHELPT